MYRHQNYFIVVCFLCLLVFFLCDNPFIFAQDAVSDEKIIERYKLMLNRKPKEGSTFDRLYQFYLEGNGLDAMIADYQAEAEAKPDDSNVQLILGHIHKRLGKDADAVKAYLRAVELSPNNYYPHFALGQAYGTLLQHENAINALKQAAALAEKTQDATPEEMTAIYKALGRAYFSRDRVDEAISAWKKIAELDPQNVFARVELADLFIEQELYEQAIAEHEEIIKFKKDDPYRMCLSRREIGNIYEAKGEYQKAIQSYDTALALTAPGNWLRKDLQHRVIGIFAADSNWQGLIEYYQQKLEATPNEPELLGLLAAAYIENQQLEEGIKVYQNGIELAPTDANLRLNLIAAFRNAEKFAEAAAEYEVLSEQDPDDFGIYRELGELYLQLEDEDKARATYQRMIDRDPKNASTHLILAEIYTGNEWMEDAIAAYQKAIALAPNNLDYIEYFGEFYFRQGNREKAIETWNGMVAPGMEIAENYDRLAKLLETKNFFTEAIAASRKVVELKPDVYEYRETLAERLMKNGDFDAALTEFKEAAKLAPNEFFAEEMDNQSIELYRRQGTLVEKIETVEAELEKSGLTDADKFTQQKRLAKMYLKLGNVTYALEILLKAKALKPNDIVVNRWLAEVYTKQNMRDDANAIYRHLIEVDSANAREYYADIARSHLNVMDFNAAIDAAKQAIAHSQRNPEGHQMLAEIAKQSANYESAIDSLKQALRLRPEAINIRSELAATFKLAGKHRQALAQYWRCWELSDSVSDKLIFVKPLSEAYYSLGRSGEFEEKLKQLSKSNTSGVAPVLALAELRRMEGDLPSARFQLARALDRERENPDLLAQLVSISLDLGDNQDALTYQQRLVKVQPDPSHQRRLGELLFDAGREQEAIQAWTKLLHAKNQTLEAEIKLAILLIRHGHLDEALFVIDRAAEKISGRDAHIAIYQLGAVLVQMNEFDRARPHFQRILEMPKPPESATKNLKASKTKITSGPPGINTDKFERAGAIIREIQDQLYSGSSLQRWIPKSFEEAQAGALVHLVTISQQQRKLDELIRQFETEAEANPKDIQKLETLAQLYSLTENTEKTNETIERLIALSPNDPTYQAIRLSKAIDNDGDSDTLQKYLNDIKGLTEEARIWYTAQYVDKLYREGKKTDAEKLISTFENTKVMELKAVYELVKALVLMDKTDAAERIIANVPVPALPHPWQFRGLYQRVIDTYIRKEQYDKAIEIFWTYCERTQPHITNARQVSKLPTASSSSSGYTQTRSNFPSSTIYYSGSRLGYLRDFSRNLWLKNQHEALYTKLQAELETAEDRNRIYPGLALSYCHWWDGQREKAQEILAMLQKEFPHDLTLKLSTALVSIQTGQHANTLKLLEELAVSDPRNRRQYNELILQLALQTGNTVAVRELIAKLLNSPSGARELFAFSKTLQNAGFTQHATAVVNKAMNLAMSVRDPNFLMELSRHLENLGKGQDAERMAERALRFSNQRDRYGRTLYNWNFQQATRIASRSKILRAREPQLVEAAKKNPNSLQAQLRLAAFYESTEQIEKASEAFEKALTLRPKDSVTRKRYADMLQRNGKPEEAVPQYTKLLKDNPNIFGYQTWEVIGTFFEAEKVDEVVSLAKEMIMPAVGRDFNNEFARDVAWECTYQEMPKAAAEIYEKLIEVKPNYIYYYQNLASAYASAGEREKAIQVLRERLKKDDIQTQEYAILLLADFYKASGKLDEFIKEYEAKLNEKPTDQTLLYLVASMKISANDLEGADKLISQMFDDAKASVSTGRIHNLSDAYRIAGAKEQELHLLEKLLENKQDSWGTYQRLGTAYAMKGETKKAKDAFGKMGTLRLLRYPNDFYEKQTVGAIYMQHQMWDEAELVYAEIMNDPSVQSYGRSEAREQLMTIKERRGDFSKTVLLKEKIHEMNIGKLRPLAKEYTRRSKTLQALEIYEHIAKVMPEDLESRAELARLYSRQNQYKKSIDTWNTLLNADPLNTKYQDGLVRTYQVAGEINQAIKLCQQYIDADAETGAHYVRLAKLYSDEDRVEDAITAYTKATELTPGKAEIHHTLAKLYLRKEDSDSAEKAFKQAIQHTPAGWRRQDIEQELMDLYKRDGKLEEILQKAETEGTLTFEMQKQRASRYQNAGEHEKAIATYKKAIEMTSDTYEKRRINESLLKMYVKLGKNDSAMEIYDSSAKSRSVESARDTAISTYKNEKKLEDLKTIFKTRLENDPDNPANIAMLAEIYRNTNDHEKAAEAYQALCKVQPNNVTSYYYAAAALNQNKQPELAKEMLTQGESALSVSRQSGSLYFLETLGGICYGGKLYDAAIKLADNALAESMRYRYYGGSSPVESVYELLGKSYLAVKQYEEAAYAYQQMANVARYSWNREEAEKGIARAFKDGNLYEKRIPKQLKEVQENPDDPDIRLTLAESYEKTSEFGEAIEQYQKISQLQPDNAQWYKKLGDLYQKKTVQRHPTGELIENTALQLDGNASFVEIENTDSLKSITQQVTVSLWMKPTAFPNRYTPIIFKGDERKSDFSHRSYILYLQEQGKVQIASSPYGRGQKSYYSDAGTVQLNKWYHIAGVIDAKTDSIKLFVDGIEVGKNTLSGKQSFYESQFPLRIGWTHEEKRPTQSPFVGLIDEVRIWNIARTEDEIRADMDVELKGDEPGLVAYWKFNEGSEGVTPDASPHKNHGRLIGNAQFAPYTRSIFKSTRSTQLTQASAAYEKAIEIEPTSYEYYRLLAETHTKDGNSSDAEAVYRRALEAPLTQQNHDNAIQAIWAFYTKNKQEDEGIAVLEEFRQKMENSTTLHELLGDAYKKAGDSDKAEIVYLHWLKIRQREVNRQQYALRYKEFAEELLNKDIFPETALKYAKRAAQSTTSSSYKLVLGQAYLVNEQYEAALEQLKQGLNALTSGTSERKFFKWVSEYGKRTTDKETFIKMLDELVNTTSGDRNIYLNFNLVLAEYCFENDMPEKAKTYIQNTGFVTEDAWLRLGPFDNSGGIGLNTEYISEDITQVNMAAKYDGKNGHVSWHKLEDDVFNGFINLGEGLNWGVAYAFTTITSPDERKVQFRFDCDDDGKLWLNGEEVYVNTRTYAAQIDRVTIPVTLKKGKNSVLVKVCEETGGWGFYLRITDENGKPFDDLKFQRPDKDR